MEAALVMPLSLGDEANLVIRPNHRENQRLKAWVIFCELGCVLQDFIG